MCPTCQQSSFHKLSDVLELSQRVSPTACRVVVGTKADLPGQRKVTSHEAEVR